MNPNLTANLRDELEQKLLRLTDIGRSLGIYETENQPISYDALQCACKKLLDERDQLIEEILNVKRPTNQRVSQ